MILAWIKPWHVATTPNSSLHLSDIKGYFQRPISRSHQRLKNTLIFLWHKDFWSKFAFSTMQTFQRLTFSHLFVECHFPNTAQILEKRACQPAIRTSAAIWLLFSSLSPSLTFTWTHVSPDGLWLYYNLYISSKKGLSYSKECTNMKHITTVILNLCPPSSFITVPSFTFTPAGKCRFDNVLILVTF